MSGLDERVPVQKDISNHTRLNLFLNAWIKYLIEPEAVANDVGKSLEESMSNNLGKKYPPLNQGVFTNRVRDERFKAAIECDLSNIKEHIVDFVQKNLTSDSSELEIATIANIFTDAIIYISSRSDRTEN